MEAAGDPDREFLREAEIGLPVGILDPLPRTPHVFEEQLKWPLDSSRWEPGLRSEVCPELLLGQGTCGVR